MLQFESVNPQAPKQALIGVRACDLAALALQDAHFLREGRRDPHYAERREQLFLVAVQCAVPAATCFCAATGDGPTPTTGFDLALAELAEGFLVEAGSERGETVMKSLALAPASARQIDAARQQGLDAAAAQTRTLPGHNLRDAPAATAPPSVPPASAMPRSMYPHSTANPASTSEPGIPASARATAICTDSTCGRISAAATASG
jgi:hypothetical protein